MSDHQAHNHSRDEHMLSESFTIDANEVASDDTDIYAQECAFLNSYWQHPEYSTSLGFDEHFSRDSENVEFLFDTERLRSDNVSSGSSNHPVVQPVSGDPSQMGGTNPTAEARPAPSQGGRV